MATILPATALQKVNLMTEEAWSPNQAQIETSTIDAAAFSKQLAAQQSLGAPFVTKVKDPKKDYDVEIWWPDFCGQEAEDYDPEDTLCGDLSAGASEVQKEAYKIESAITDKFSINEATFAGSFLDFQRFLVAEQNQRVVNILNKLNEKYLLALHANAGLNKGGQFSLDGQNRALVSGAEFENTKLVTKIMLDAEKSNVRNPYMITGDNQMYLTVKDAMFNGANGEGKGDANRARFYDITLDVRGFMKTPTLSNSTFMVSPYALNFQSKNYYQNSAPVYDNDLGKWKYSIRIPAYGLVIDVLHQRTCVDAVKDRYSHVFNYICHYDFFLNPKGCLDDATSKRVTGILEYLNGSGGSSSSA